MELYQHDGPDMFRFELRGGVSGAAVYDLEQAWNTAASILRGKQLIVDVSAVTNADAGGLDLLIRMRASGARLIAALPPKSQQFVRLLGLPAATPARRRRSWLALQLSSLVRLKTY